MTENPDLYRKTFYGPSMPMHAYRALHSVLVDWVMLGNLERQRLADQRMDSGTFVSMMRSIEDGRLSVRFMTSAEETMWVWIVAPREPGDHGDPEPIYLAGSPVVGIGADEALLMAEQVLLMDAELWELLHAGMGDEE